MESVILSGPTDCKIRRKYPLPAGYEDNYDNFNDPFFQSDPLGLPEDDEEVSDPYFVWRRNAPFVYDSVSVYNLNWPSLVVEFMDDSLSLRVKNGLATQRLLLGTHTSGTETEFAMIAELRTSLYSLKENMTNCENYNNFVSARKKENGPVLPNSPNLDIIAKIVHPGEINRISHAPKINFSFLTQSNNGTIYMFDYTKHHSNPRELNNSYPQLVLGNGHYLEGYGLAWNSSMKLASCASDGTLCLWDLNSTPATVTKDFSGVVDNVSVITPLLTYSNNSYYGSSTSFKPKNTTTNNSNFNNNSTNNSTNNTNNNNKSNITNSKTKSMNLNNNYENGYELSYPSTIGSDTDYVNDVVLTASGDYINNENSFSNSDNNNNNLGLENNNNNNFNNNNTTNNNNNTNLEKLDLYQKMDPSLMANTQYEHSQYSNNSQNTNNGLNDVEFLYNNDNVVLTASDDGNVYMVDFRTPSNFFSNNTGLSKYNSSYNNFNNNNNTFSTNNNNKSNCMNSVLLVDSGINTLSINTYNTNYFVCGCENGNIYLFDLRLPNKYLLLLEQHKESVSQIEFNRNCCGLFASCSNDSTVCIFDLSCRGQELRFIHQGHKSQVNDISWSKLNHIQTSQLGFTLASVAEDNLLQCFTPNYFSL